MQAHPVGWLIGVAGSSTKDVRRGGGEAESWVEWVQKRTGEKEFDGTRTSALVAGLCKPPILLTQDSRSL